MNHTYNGMPAAELPDVTWEKSKHSNPNGACVEVARLPEGAIAVRNSRFPSGPALVYTRAEIEAFLAGRQGRRVRSRALIIRTSAPVIDCRKSRRRREYIDGSYFYAIVIDHSSAGA